MKSKLLESLAAHELVMWRPNLAEILPVQVSEGFRLRPFGPGSVADWVRIHELADPDNNPDAALHERQFGSDLGLLAARQFFLETTSGQAVGTSSAWFLDDKDEGNWGRVHWVAILPEYQGRGLAHPLLAQTLVTLKKLGHSRTFLTTDQARVAALGLYRRHGFKTFSGAED